MSECKDSHGENTSAAGRVIFNRRGYLVLFDKEI